MKQNYGYVITKKQTKQTSEAVMSRIKYKIEHTHCLK